VLLIFGLFFMFDGVSVLISTPPPPPPPDHPPPPPPPGTNTTLTGYLLVTTSLVNQGDIFLNGAKIGTGTALQELTQGTYTVSFGDVQGYNTPPSQSASVSAGQTTKVVGEYTPKPSSTVAILEVTTSGASGEIYIDGVYEGTGSASVSYNASGSHQVSFGPVSGFVTPSSQTVQVALNKTTTVVGTYTPEGPPPPGVTYVHIKVQVIASNGQGVSGIEVDLKDSSGRVIDTQYTDANGWAVFTRAANSGTYIVHAGTYPPSPDRTIQLGSTDVVIVFKNSVLRLLPSFMSALDPTSETIVGFIAFLAGLVMIRAPVVRRRQ